LPSCTPTSAVCSTGLGAAIGADMIFDDLDDALRAVEASRGREGRP
jgi:hypothetical protein